MKFGYRKIFLGETSAQQLNLEEVDQIFEDRITGSSSNLPELEDLIRFSNQGDKVTVQNMDRLGRDVRNLYKIISSILEKGASIHFIDEDMSFYPIESGDTRETPLRLFEKLAKFEGRMIKRRQSEGIYRAKKMKKYKGRQATLDPKKIAAEFLKTGKVSVVAKNLGISRMSVYRILKSHK